MSKEIKNYTFSLPIDLLDKVREYSNEGYIPSVNFAVKEAIETYVKSLDKQKLYEEMKKASKDPLFLSDLNQVIDDFSNIDYEQDEEDL